MESLFTTCVIHVEIDTCQFEWWHYGRRTRNNKCIWNRMINNIFTNISPANQLFLWMLHSESHLVWFLVWWPSGLRLRTLNRMGYRTRKAMNLRVGPLFGAILVLCMAPQVAYCGHFSISGVWETVRLCLLLLLLWWHVECTMICKIYPYILCWYFRVIISFTYRSIIHHQVVKSSLLLNASTNDPHIFGVFWKRSNKNNNMKKY